MSITRRALPFATLALLLLSPAIGVAAARIADDRPTLRDVQAQALPLFEDTARLIDPAYDSRPHPGSDPIGPYEIPGDPFGYQKCDSWRDWILPGWSAGTWHEFDVPNDAERQAIIADVHRLWSAQDGRLEVRDSSSQHQLTLTAGDATYRLFFKLPDQPPAVPDGSIIVSVDCLPAD